MAIDSAKNEDYIWQGGGIERYHNPEYDPVHMETVRIDCSVT